ncbi:MAG: hypothetical protein AB1847_13220 [bacterium]
MCSLLFPVLFGMEGIRLEFALFQKLDQSPKSTQKGKLATTGLKGKIIYLYRWVQKVR